jgi:uncharacterized membrane protein
MPISKTLSDPGTGHLSPITPVRDTTASAVEQVGRLGVGLAELHQQKQRQQVELEKEQAAQDFAARGEELRQQAELFGEGFVNQTMPKFDRELNKYIAGEQQGRFSYDSLRLHAESLLKRYSKDATQEQRQKLRQVMDQALGFDPTGSGVSIEKAIQLENAKFEAERRSDYIRRGGIPDLYGTDEGEAWYFSRTRMDQEAADISTRLQRAKDRKEFDSLEAPRGLQVTSNMMYHTTRDLISAMVMSKFKKSINELTDADIQSIDSTLIEQFKVDMNAKRGELSQVIRNQFGEFTNISDSNMTEALRPVNDYIDLVLGRLDKSTSLAQLKAQNDYADQLVRLNIMNDEKARRYHLLTKFFPGIPLSPTTNSDTIVSLHSLASGKKTEIFSKDKDQRGFQVKHYQAIIDGVKNYDKASNEQKELFEVFVKAVAKESINDYRDMSQGQRDALMELMQNPNFATTMTRFTGEAENMSTIIRSYVDNTVFAMGARLVEQERAGDTSGMIPTGKIGSLVDFKMTPQGFAMVRKTTNIFETQAVDTFKLNYLDRVNKGLRALANMEGRSVQDVIKDLTDENVGIPGLRKLFKEEAE